MNGRMYDPILGRFLGVDPVVQGFDNSQSFNGYSYCQNNPLVYIDPSGYRTLFGHLFNWAGEQLGNGLRLLGNTVIYAICLIPSLCDAITNGPSRLDPTYNGTISNNAIKIRDGLFQGTPNQIISRFYYESFQSTIGIEYSELANLFGTVKSVNYYDGATVAQSYKNHVWLGSGTGVTFGNFINGSNEIEANPNNSLFQHEYGHYLQSQIFGNEYLFGYGLPSLYGDGKHHHDFNPAEQDANVRAFIYFNKTVIGFNDEIPSGDNHGWNFDYNPIDPNHTFSRNIYWDYNNPSHLGLIKSLIINPNFGYIKKLWWLP